MRQAVPYDSVANCLGGQQLLLSLGAAPCCKPATCGMSEGWPPRQAARGLLQSPGGAGQQKQGHLGCTRGAVAMPSCLYSSGWLRWAPYQARPKPTQLLTAVKPWTRSLSQPALQTSSSYPGRASQREAWQRVAKFWASSRRGLHNNAACFDWAISQRRSGTAVGRHPSSMRAH